VIAVTAIGLEDAMLEAQPEVRRRRDGSLDLDFYRREAARLRSETIRAFARSIWRQLRRLYHRGGGKRRAPALSPATLPIREWRW